MRGSILLLLPLLAGGCAGLGTAPAIPASSVPVDASFARGGGAFGSGTTLPVAVDARDAGGRLEICGAWAPHSLNGHALYHIPDVLSAGQVELGGRTVLSDPARLARLPDDATLEGASARCFLTGEAWRPTDATAPLTVRLPRETFSEASSRGHSGNGNSETFSQLPTVQPAARRRAS